MLCMDKLKEKAYRALKNNGIDTEYFADSVEAFYKKIEAIYKNGKCQGLLKSFFGCNDPDNLLALIFEISFAFDFLSRSGNLQYEAKQDPSGGTKIDFLYETNNSWKVYFELRLVQETKAIRDEIQAQLAVSSHYSVEMDGAGDQRELSRLQRVMLEKCFKDGKPVKFFAKGPDIYNIIVVNVGDLILGAIDRQDCKLVAYGDFFVEEVYRRGISGLFGNDDVQNLDIQAFRNMIAGILFVRNSPKATSRLDMDLEYVLMHNPRLMNKATRGILISEFVPFMKPWGSNN